MKYLRCLGMIVFLLLPIHLIAQEDIKVESFILSTTTNYANLHGYIEYDDNGEKCALIIVDTRNPELLSFEGGALAIKKVIVKSNQAWVYVPNGLKRITISGKGMHTLRDFDLGTSVQAARTYILKLTTKDVETIVFNDSIQTYMCVRVISERDNTPITEADFSINGLKESLDSNGIFEKQLSGATYRYRVEAEYYKTATGNFVVDGKSNEYIIKMKPNYEFITINVPDGCEIWVDAQKMGNDTWTGKLTLGEHIVTCKRDKHYDEERNITIVEGRETELSFDKLRPIIGILNVNTIPIGADVLVDGSKIGVTPYKDSIIIGNHDVKLVKKGYTTAIEKVSINQNQEHIIDVSLKQTHEVVIATSPVRAQITVDGKYVGTTPVVVEMRPGKHMFEVKADGFYQEKTTKKISDNQTGIDFHLNKQKYNSNEIYIGISYRIVPFSGWQVYIGGYLKNMNIELGYCRAFKSSEPIYWYSVNTDNWPTKAIYSGSIYKINLGYGMVLNNTFRITPQLGISHTVLKESTNNNERYADGAYYTSICIGTKLDVSISKWIALTIVPDYSVQAKKSEGFRLLNDVSNTVGKFSYGLGMHVGVNVRF